MPSPFTRRAFLGSVATALLAGRGSPRLASSADPPATGRADPRLAPFDRLMTEFLKENQAPGGALAVTRRGRLVYARGFGLADEDRGTPVRPDSLFRIASVSKPLTATAVLQLAERGELGLDDPVLNYVRLGPHLEFGARPDPRWRAVTARQCLQHTGGWDLDRSFDPVLAPEEVAVALGTRPPVSPADVIRYMMGRPLDFDPGSRFAYSNFGYLLLGRVVEAASGSGYEEYVRREVLAPLGVTRPRLGRALPEHREPGEVRYYDSQRRTGVCLYPPRAGLRVPTPDGVANFEAFEAHGGWVASAVDLVRFASAFDDPETCPVLGPASVRMMWARPSGAAGLDADGLPPAEYYGCGWHVRPGAAGAATEWQVRVGAAGAVTLTHAGLISGTSALLVRRSDGLNWAVLFNTGRDPEGHVLALEIDPLVHAAADQVREWPDVDLFGS